MISREQVFTDDDIKRLKAEIPEEGYCHQICIHCGYNVKALLARLEAAEACIRKVAFHLKYTDALDAWRKSCGRE